MRCWYTGYGSVVRGLVVSGGWGPWGSTETKVTTALRRRVVRLEGAAGGVVVEASGGVLVETSRGVLVKAGSGGLVEARGSVLVEAKRSALVGISLVVGVGSLSKRLLWALWMCCVVGRRRRRGRGVHLQRIVVRPLRGRVIDEVDWWRWVPGVSWWWGEGRVEGGRH